MAVLLETALAYFVLALRRPWRLWARAVVGLAVLVPWGWWVSEFVVHAPGYWILHMLWVWILIVLLALSALLSAGTHIYAWRIRGKGNA